MATLNKDLGVVTAYGYALDGGYSGTESQFKTDLAQAATVGQTKADKVTNATSGNLAALDSNGNLTDSGKSKSATVPSGGTTGQVLKKKSGTNYDTEWATLDDANAYHTGDTAETALADGDYFPFYDTSATGKRKTLWSNIKAKLKTYFDGLYSAKATSKGSATKGVYFDANGAVQEMSYTVGKSVPSDAVFTDTKVTQTNTTGSADYRVLLSENANDTTQTVGARKSTNFKANPSTGVLSTPKVKISKSANALITGSGTAGSDKGSGVSPRYYPAKWTFNLGGNPNDGDIITIKIPVAGGTYSEWLSTDNGTTYHPIALNGKSRITSQYAVNTFLTLIYESSGVCTTYALAGADTVTDITGTWRVINYYDSNTTYSSMSQSEATTGTATTGRLITAKVLNDTISNKANGHTILNGSGSAMAQRSKLQFDGATVTDDGTNGKTIITTTPQSMIGDAWVLNHAYAVGDYCIDGNVLYKCKTAHTSSASNRPPYASYWTAVSVASELGRLDSSNNPIVLVNTWYRNGNYTWDMVDPSSFTQNGDLSLDATTDTYYGKNLTVYNVDLTNYSTIRLTIKSITSSGDALIYIGRLNKGTPQVVTYVSKGVGQSGILEMNVSSYTGSFWIGISAQHDYNTMVISKLEVV